jgi:hypothetical protein
MSPLPATRVDDLSSQLNFEYLATTAPVLVTSFVGVWTNYAATVFGPARYWRMGDMVYLGGLVTKTGVAVVAGETILVLPAGWRPQLAEVFVVDTGTHGRVDVNPDGSVIWRSGTSGVGAYTSLNGIYFWSQR